VIRAQIPLYLNLMARRPTKLEFHDLPSHAHNCRAELVVHSAREYILHSGGLPSACKRDSLNFRRKAVRPSSTAEKVREANAVSHVESTEPIAVHL
jgi:hypothetical protein